MLEYMVAVIGPPAEGKTTLTMRMGEAPDCRIFRLRDHVPDTILAATATRTDRPGWIDDVTVARALRRYIEHAVADGPVRTVLLDNFPGTATQVRLLLGVLHRLAPGCVVHALELVIGEGARERRVLGCRVCHRCEQDPIHDPRIPAIASQDDPKRCARCGGVLHPRRGDAPRLLAARTRRYESEVVGIRAAFAESDIHVAQLDSSREPGALVLDLAALVAERPAPGGI